MSQKNILQFLITGAKKAPHKQALIDSAGAALTYSQLLESVKKIMAGLSASGVQNNHRVAAVMTEGIDWVVSFFGVSSIAAFVPLDPAYSYDQFVYYFNLLNFDYLLLSEGTAGSVVKAAQEAGIPIIYFSRGINDNAFSYRINTETEQENTVLMLSGEDEIALICFSSGTTSTPKIVPVSHANLYHPTLDVINFFELTAEDRSLVISPLFKGVALNNALWSLASGGSAVLAADFQPDHFFSLLKEYRPTWFRAAPALHLSLIEYAQRHKISLKDSALRFVRTGGAYQDESLTEKMSALYGVPIELSYGLAEARTVASTYKAPKGYKSGSVGISIGPEIGIMNEEGRLLPSGELGEVVVKGPGVFKGYANEDIRNEDIFWGEWFRTGDLGYLDEDGYLFLKGRIKEFINRGGEKVSPFELEQILLDNPAVSAVAVFPITDSNGNEEVGALIVPEGGQSLELKGIRSFLSGKIAHYKMPTKLYLGDSIPINATGKVARKSLHSELEANPGKYRLLTENNVEGGPKTPTEESISNIFCQLLNLKAVDKTSSFFELGGDSLRAAVLFAEIQDRFNKQIPLSYIYSHGSVQELAQYLESSGKGVYSFVVPIQEFGTKPPLFFVHPASGEVVAYQYVSQYMSKDRPVYGLRMNVDGIEWSHPLTFRSIAQKYLEEIKLVHPHGPYLFSGTCMGGVLAYEMAQQLIAAGEKVSFLGLFDPIIVSKNSTRTKLKRAFSEAGESGVTDGVRLLKGKTVRRLRYYRISLSMRLYKYSPPSLQRSMSRFMAKEALLRYARRTYEIERYPGEIVFFKPEENTPSTLCSLEKWKELVNTVHVVPIKVRHNALFSWASAKYLAEALEGAIDAFE